MAKEKKTLEDKVTELTSLLGDEEERAKQLAKTKNKYEAIIAELEERLKKEQEVHTLPFDQYGLFSEGIITLSRRLSARL